MKVLEEVIRPVRCAWEKTEEGWRVAATIEARRESKIYAAHFPGMAVTPGVLMIGAAVEICERASGKRLRLKKVNSVKYLSMMTPDDIDGATIAATLTTEGTVSATYSKAEKTYAKMKLSTTMG